MIAGRALRQGRGMKPATAARIAERERKRIKRGRFVLRPATDSTHGHGMHSWAAFWQGELRKLLGTPAR